MLPHAAKSAGVVVSNVASDSACLGWGQRLGMFPSTAGDSHMLVPLAAHHTLEWPTWGQAGQKLLTELSSLLPQWLLYFPVIAAGYWEDFPGCHEVWHWCGAHVFPQRGHPQLHDSQDGQVGPRFLGDLHLELHPEHVQRHQTAELLAQKCPPASTQGAASQMEHVNTGILVPFLQSQNQQFLRSLFLLIFVPFSRLWKQEWCECRLCQKQLSSSLKLLITECWFFTLPVNVQLNIKKSSQKCLLSSFWFLSYPQLNETLPVSVICLCILYQC